MAVAPRGAGCLIPMLLCEALRSTSPQLHFHVPLIEPDVQIGDITLIGQGATSGRLRAPHETQLSACLAGRSGLDLLHAEAGAHSGSRVSAPCDAAGRRALGGKLFIERLKCMLDRPLLPERPGRRPVHEMK